MCALATVIAAQSGRMRSWVVAGLVAGLAGPATPREDAFYLELFALPETFRVDPAADRSGPTIRILRLDAPGD